MRVTTRMILAVKRYGIVEFNVPLDTRGPWQKATGQKVTETKDHRQKATRQKASETKDHRQKATERNVNIELMEGSVC